VADEELLAVTTTQYVLKSSWEVLRNAFTYKVGSLSSKRVEQEDYFDRSTDFTPFSLKA